VFYVFFDSDRVVSDCTRSTIGVLLRDTGDFQISEFCCIRLYFTVPLLHFW